ncbi:hypothetical protein BKA70DRAFT_1242206 [Coprinopsis sp. MPI-PUGE-AT-0042]|nr:hypothetical protein BKA70DRAFT_1242206 [Coprinopsis sp. MPI-PUGE-AT-0042]
MALAGTKKHFWILEAGSFSSTALVFLEAWNSKSYDMHPGFIARTRRLLEHHAKLLVSFHSRVMALGDLHYPGPTLNVTREKFYLLIFVLDIAQARTELETTCLSSPSFCRCILDVYTAREPPHSYLAGSGAREQQVNLLHILSVSLQRPASRDTVLDAISSPHDRSLFRRFMKTLALLIAFVYALAKELQATDLGMAQLRESLEYLFRIINGLISDQQFTRALLKRGFIHQFVSIAHYVGASTTNSI